MPASPRAARQLLQCPQCPKRFGKQVKLDSHLLSHHDATLRLSPGVLSPPPSPSVELDFVRTAVTAALQEANRDPRPTCSLCPPPVRAFRNKRDLAQHFVSKHAAHLADSDLPSEHPSGMTSSAVAPAAIASSVMAEPRAQSETSVNSRKRPLDAVAASQPTGLSQHTTVSSPPDPLVGKRRRVTSSLSPPVPKPTGSKPPVTPKRSPKVNSVVAPKTSALRAAAAAAVAVKARDASSSPTVSDRTHVEPKAGGLGVAQSSAVQSEPRPSVACAEQPIPVIPTIRAVTTAPIDFSCVGGFATNARKSYYRLTNR